MGLKIHHINTGELQNSLPTSLLNSAATPDLAYEDRLPSHHRTTHYVQLEPAETVKKCPKNDGTSRYKAHPRSGRC
jgi:hypothetical protein